MRPAADGNGYEIAAGERRYRASLLAGLTEVPVLVRDFTDEQMLEVGLVENLQRENLSVLDEVEGKLRLIALRLGGALPEARQRLIGNLRNEEPGDTAVFSEIFAMTGRETWQSFAKNKVRILQWPEEVLAAMRERGLAYSLAAVVAAAPADLRPGLLKQALAGATSQPLASRPGTKAASRVAKVVGSSPRLDEADRGTGSTDAARRAGSLGRLVVKGFNTDSAKFRHSREDTACGSIPRNPYVVPTRIRSD